MKGVLTYNGSRQVYGVGDTWRTDLATSVSYSHSWFGIASRNPEVTHITTNGGKHSGKIFFQVFHGRHNVISISGMPYSTGLRHEDMTTLSDAAHTKNNLVWQFDLTNPKLCRYSTTSTGTFSGNTLFGAKLGQWWESIAVDFDNGKIWFGVLDQNSRTNIWVNGGNPSAGTGEALTFTASTTLHAFTYLRIDGSFPDKTTIFVAETNNLVDIPTGFTPWNSNDPTASLTATPSGTVGSGGGRVLWPYGVQT
jgi:hypothetical protein